MLQLTNNAKSTLSFGITAGDTSVEIASADASLFPALTLADDYFMAALANNPSSGGTLKYEYVKVTAVASNVFTIERAQEGTTAQAFDAGDRFELRMTAEAMADMRGDVWGRPTSSGAVVIPTFSDANTFVIAGDFTEVFATYRAVRAYQTSDDSGFVTSSTYDSGDDETTVVVENMTLDSGLALVEYGMDTASAPKYTHAATADSADDAATLDGNSPSDFATSGHNHSGIYEPVISSKNDGFNLALATQAQAEAGAVNTVGMTPLRVAQAIAELASSTAAETSVNKLAHSTLTGTNVQADLDQIDTALGDIPYKITSSTSMFAYYYASGNAALPSGGTWMFFVLYATSVAKGVQAGDTTVALSGSAHIIAWRIA